MPLSDNSLCPLVDQGIISRYVPFLLSVILTFKTVEAGFGYINTSEIDFHFLNQFQF
jgi:hypothetical protein